MSIEEQKAARALLADLLDVIDRHELAADGALGRQMEPGHHSVIAGLNCPEEVDGFRKGA